MKMFGFTLLSMVSSVSLRLLRCLHSCLHGFLFSLICPRFRRFSLVLGGTARNATMHSQSPCYLAQPKKTKDNMKTKTIENKRGTAKRSKKHKDYKKQGTAKEARNMKKTITTNVWFKLENVSIRK